MTAEALVSLEEYLAEDNSFWLRNEARAGCVSPSSDFQDQRKIPQYLESGAAVVWVLHPQTRQVAVQRPGQRGLLLRLGDVLDEPDRFPGFEVPRERLFPPRP